MDGKKKAAGWLVLAAIATVAAVALATTNLVTEGPIAQRNLGEAQAALEEMFPETDAQGFESIATEESGGLQFAYRVMKDGQVIGYAFKETAQGYAGPVEVLAGMNADKSLRGITVGGSGFQETEGLGSKAKDPTFTDQFKGKTLPLSLGEDIDGIAGATITSRAVVEGLNQGANKLEVLLGGASQPMPDGSAAPDNSTAPDSAGAPSGGTASRMANASVIGYGGPVLVSLGLDDKGNIATLNVGQARFAETDGLGSKVREESFTAQFIGKTPPVSLDDVDAVAGATVSSQAVVDAINEAAEFVK